MNSKILGMGAATNQLALDAATRWSETATQNDIDLTGFDPTASLEERKSWANDRGIETGTIYARFASGQQSSPDEQVRECVEWAAKNQIFVPPEFISVDSETSGHRNHRAGFKRMKAIVGSRSASVLLVSDLNRLNRETSRAIQLVNRLIAESGCRVVCVADSIDTDDRFRWQMVSVIVGELFRRENRRR